MYAMLRMDSLKIIHTVLAKLGGSMMGLTVHGAMRRLAGATNVYLNSCVLLALTISHYWRVHASANPSSTSMILTRALDAPSAVFTVTAQQPAPYVMKIPPSS